jgi:hypothetical protein
MGLTDKEVDTVLADLEREGSIVQDAEGRWSTTAKGNAEYTGPTKCDWPKCSAQSESAFDDGWTNYGKAKGLLKDLPAEGMLCPVHKRAFSALALVLDADLKPSPSISAH